MTILRYVEKGESKNLQPDEEYVPVREFLGVLKAAHDADRQTVICGVCNVPMTEFEPGKWHHTGECSGTEMNWQPIETAPKVGAFLVWIPTTDLPWPAYRDGKFLRSNAHGILNAPDVYDGRVLRATHWMPIPSAPTSEGHDQ